MSDKCVELNIIFLDDEQKHTKHTCYLWHKLIPIDDAKAFPQMTKKQILNCLVIFYLKYYNSNMFEMKSQTNNIALIDYDRR